MKDVSRYQTCMTRGHWAGFRHPGVGGGGSLICCIGMYGPKGYGFATVLVRVSILTDFGHFGLTDVSKVWLLYSSLDMDMFLRRSYFFTITEKKINKNLSQFMFTVI